MMKVLIEVAIAFAIWAILLYIVKKKGGEHFTIVGPLIMWKTEKGKKLIDRIARKKIWKRYGDFSIAVTIVAMVLTTWLIVRSVYLSFKITRTISPRLMIGLPGINPVIPIWYGIAAIAIAIIFHEFSHGILARVAKIRINSLGLLFLIFPVGAFVEPDEEKLLKEKRIKRARVFSAGPTTNIMIAIISILLLSFVFSPAIAPKEKGVVTIGNIEGIKEWSIITGIDGSDVENTRDFDELAKSFEAGRAYNISFFKDGEIKQKKYVHGIIVAGVVKNSPAYGKIKRGYGVYMINGIKMNNITTFMNFMNTTHENEKINISYYYDGAFGNISIVLANKYNYTHDAKDKDRGFIGISVANLRNMVVEPDYFINLYNPFKTNFFVFVSLPFHGLSPFPKELAALYSYPMQPLFLPLMNFFYWLFWLNFALGTFNALPALPLDGGYVFKDGVSWLIEKLKLKKGEKIVDYIASSVSFMIIIAIFSMILIPNLRALL